MDGVRFGRAVRALRRRRGWRQADLGAHANVSQDMVSRIEIGRLGPARVDVLAKVAAALDADLVLELRWHGERLDRMLDAAHAALVEEILGRLRRLGWQVIPEVSFSIYGERGSVDLLAFHPGMRVVLVVEVKSAIPDVQSMLASIDRKQRNGARIAASRGWTASGVARLLVVRDSGASRRRVAAHRGTFDAAFPLRGHEMSRWLARPTAVAVSGLMFLPLTHPDRAKQRSGARERVRIPRSRSTGGRA